MRGRGEEKKGEEGRGYRWIDRWVGSEGDRR